jgi:hypothetical protein
LVWWVRWACGCCGFGGGWSGRRREGKWEGAAAVLKRTRLFFDWLGAWGLPACLALPCLPHAPPPFPPRFSFCDAK